MPGDDQRRRRMVPAEYDVCATARAAPALPRLSVLKRRAAKASGFSLLRFHQRMILSDLASPAEASNETASGQRGLAQAGNRHLGQFDDQTVAQRDAAIHLRRDVEVMRRDDGGET